MPPVRQPHWLAGPIHGDGVNGDLFRVPATIERLAVDDEPKPAKARTERARGQRHQRTQGELAIHSANDEQSQPRIRARHSPMMRNTGEMVRSSRTRTKSGFSRPR